MPQPSSSADFLAGATPVQAAPSDFLANATPVTPDLTANPNGQGTYRMVGPKGPVQIPYGNVDTAKQQGYKFATQDDLSRYDKDAGTSLWQRAKNNFNYNTQGAQAGDNPVKAAVENFGAGGADQIRALAHPGQIVNGVVQTVAHPIDTAKGMVAAAEQNPARFAGNVATGALLGEGAGAAAGAASEAGGALAGRAALLGKTPEEAYESALKPSTTLTQAERERIVRTGLDNAIPVSKSGVEKLTTQVNDLNNAIKAEIGSDPTRPIDPNAVATRVNAVKSKFANQVNAQPDLNAIEASRQQFLAEQGAMPGKPGVPPQPAGLFDANGNPIMTAGTPATPPIPAPPMNAADAQAMKQGTYKILAGKYGEQGSATVEAQKALARGLKEEIANQFPEIGNLNAQESRLLDLQPVLERAVARNSNHQFIGIGTPIAGEAVKSLTGSGSAGAVATVLKGALDNPMVKSRLAIAISKGAKIPYARAMARVAAYSSTLGALQASDSNGAAPSQ